MCRRRFLYACSFFGGILGFACLSGQAFAAGTTEADINQGLVDSGTPTVTLGAGSITLTKVLSNPTAGTSLVGAANGSQPGTTLIGASGQRILTATRNIGSIENITFTHAADAVPFTGMGGAVSATNITGGIRNSAFINNQVKHGTGSNYGNASALYVSGSLQGGMENVTFSGNYGPGVYTAYIKQNLTGGLTNVTFKDNRVGNTHPNSLQAGGGGLTIDGSLEGDVVGSHFENNYSSQNTGGALSLNGSLKGNVRNTTFSKNTTGDFGGGLSVWGSMSGEVRGVTFTENTTGFGLGTNSAMWGGGLFVYSGLAGGIHDSTFTGNRAANGGGYLTFDAIQNDISGSTFTENYASVGGGAAFMNSGMSGSILNSHFIRNSSDGPGGAIYANERIGTIQGSSFVGNTALQGGALALSKLNVRIGSTTFDGNTVSGVGGAIRATDATLELVNPLFTENSAGANGGAIWSNNEVEITVEDGKTGLFRGNTAGGRQNSVHFSKTGNLIATVGDAGVLSMHGGITGDVEAGERITVTKTGGGLWRLGGASAFTVADDTASVAWQTSGGVLHLIGAGEMLDGVTAPEDGFVSLAGSQSTITIGDGTGATLVEVGGANALEAAGGLRLAAGTNITVTAAGSSSLRLNGRDGKTAVDGTLRLDTGAATEFTVDAAFTGGNAITRMGTGQLTLARANVFAEAPLVLRQGSLASAHDQTFGSLTMSRGTSAAFDGALTIASGSLRGSVRAGSLRKSGSGTLSVYEPVTLSGAMTMDGGKLDIHLKEGTAAISADSFDYRSGALNIVGFSGQDVCESSATVISTNTVIQSRPDANNFTIVDVDKPTCRFMIVTLGLDPTGTDLIVKTKLNWYNDDMDEVDGRFGIAQPDASFELGAVLKNRISLPTNLKGWDGKTLTKGGPGTLALSAVNTYSGGTIIEDGQLIAMNDKALGEATGVVRFTPLTPDSKPSLRLEFAGTLENDIMGQGNLDVAGDVTYSGDRSGHRGVVSILEGNFTTTAAAGNQAFDTLRMEADTSLTVQGGDITVGDGVISGTVTGSRDFVLGPGGSLSLDGIVSVDRDVIATGGSLDLNITKNQPVIIAGNSADFDNSTFNITGYSGKAGSGPVHVVDAQSIVNGPVEVTVGGSRLSSDSYLQVQLSEEADGLYITTGLAWHNMDMDADSKYNRAHGNFHIDGGNRFELSDVELTNRGTHIFASDWDGNSMKKTGDGTLVLAGKNSFDGGINLLGGTIVSKHAEALGGCTATLADGTVLRLQHDGELKNGVEGTGAVQVRGEQTWTGDWSNYRGAVTLERGWIDLGTSGGPGVITDGSFALGENTLLTGTGSIGALTLGKGSRLAIGYSIGTLQVKGDAVFDAESRFVVEVDPATPGSSDHLHVTGAAYLNNATVVHRGLGNQESYSPLGEWTILTADGGVNGRFNPDVVAGHRLTNTDESGVSRAAPESGTALLRYSLLYPNPNDVVLRVERNSRTFTDFAVTGNQYAVASGLETLGSDSELYNRVLGMVSEDDLAPLYDQLSGEMHPSFRRMLMGYERAFGNALMDRAGQAYAQPDSFPVWVEVGGYGDRISGDGNAHRATLKGVRTSIGLEKRFLGGWLVGAAFQYGNNTFKTNDVNSRADVDSYSFGLYAGREWEFAPGTLRLSLGGGFGHHDVDSKRYVSSSVLNQDLRADYHANTAQVFADAGYRFDFLAGTTVEPFLRLGWNTVRTSSFREFGGIAALGTRHERQSNLSQTLGVRAAKRIGNIVEVNASAGWLHTYGSKNIRNAFRFLDGDAALTVHGIKTPASLATVSAGIAVDLTDQMRVHLGYDGHYGSRTRNHAGNIALQVTF